MATPSNLKRDTDSTLKSKEIWMDVWKGNEAEGWITRPNGCHRIYETDCEIDWLSEGLGSNTYLYLNTQISVLVFVFEKPQDEIFMFVFDWHIWVYLTNLIKRIWPKPWFSGIHHQKVRRSRLKILMLIVEPSLFCIKSGQTPCMTSTDWKERKKNKSREEIFYQMKVVAFLLRSVVGSVFCKSARCP